MPVRTPFHRPRSARTPIGFLIWVLGVVSLIVATAGCTSPEDDASSIVRTTTKIAGAGVVGIERDTTQACAQPTPPDAAAGATRTVSSVDGDVRVPTDPQRIVVLTTGALDTACAVGLWERVVGAATVAGPTPQPTYLGTGIAELPSIGLVNAPDLHRITEARPDLILGDTSVSVDRTALSEVAPTVLVDDSAGWQEQFTALAAALGRTQAGQEALAAYRAEAEDTGAQVAASRTQASLVRFTPQDTIVVGTNTFAAQILADTNTQRPTAQRGKSFSWDAEDPEAAEGDLIYVMFAGEQGQDRGESRMESRAWKDLGAVTDKRVFVVDDALWHTQGLTAARAILTDIRNTLNGYVME